MEETVLAPRDYDHVIVTVAHPHGDVETTLREWIRIGPGPRPFVGITAARWDSGEALPLQEIPLEFHNSSQSRKLQRMGLLPTPWGPPPDEEPEY